MIELWKDITGYETLYQISNFGRYRRLNKNGTVKKILTFSGSRYRYQNAQLCKNGLISYYGVHRLVALAFIPNPDNKTEINHKDGNKQNNIVTNLEWATPLENISHGWKTGLITGLRISKNVLQLNLDGTFYTEYSSIKEACASLGLKQMKTGLERRLQNNSKKPYRGFIWVLKEAQSV